MKCALLPAILVMTSMGCATVSPIPASEMSVMSVNIGDDELVVIEKLGSPVRRQAAEGHHELYLDYGDLVIFFSGGNVDALYADGASACTPSMICPGASVSDLVRTYGAPAKGSDRSLSTWKYAIQDSDCWFEFALNNEEVNSIELKCSI